MGCGTLSPSERAASRQTQLSSLSVFSPSFTAPPRFPASMARSQDLHPEQVPNSCCGGRPPGASRRPAPSAHLPSQLLRHTWRPPAWWKSDRACAACRGTAGRQVGRQGWGGRVGAALAGQGESRRRPVLCDLELLARPLWAQAARSQRELGLQG